MYDKLQVRLVLGHVLTHIQVDEHEIVVSSNNHDHNHLYRGSRTTTNTRPPSLCGKPGKFLSSYVVYRDGAYYLESRHRYDAAFFGGAYCTEA
jgi:hypothetical protein